MLNAIDYKIGGKLDPFYFHLSIFTWYVIQCILVFFLFKRIFDLAYKQDMNATIALFATAWYAMHPANADTINYIISRSDSFSTLCIVASFVLYQVERTRKWCLYLLTMLVGLLTKETGVMFAPLLFLYILLFEEKMSLVDFRSEGFKTAALSALRKASPALIITVVVFLSARYTFKSVSGLFIKDVTTRLDYFFTQTYVIMYYLSNLLIPLNLSADPDYKIIREVIDPRIIYSLIGHVILIGMAFFASRDAKSRPFTFGIFWFYLALAPTSSIHPLGQIANTHRTFFPYLGLIAPGSIPRSLLRTFNFEIWKLKCLGACPEDLYCQS